MSRRKYRPVQLERLAHLSLVSPGAFLGKGHSRGSVGRRADLGGLFLRSQWEANYARYLNLLKRQGKIADWQYEPQTFVFEAIKRGTRAYTPDFKVIAIDGSFTWHEVKGWMDPKSATRLSRMAKYYPDEIVIVIDGKFFRAAAKSGLANIIPNWEGHGKKSQIMQPISKEPKPRRTLECHACGTLFEAKSTRSIYCSVECRRRRRRGRTAKRACANSRLEAAAS